MSFEYNFFRLTPKNSYKVFSFRIAPEDEKTEKIEDWIRVIRENLQASEGSRKLIPSKDYKLKFWKVTSNFNAYWSNILYIIKNRGITLENFAKKVDTFDILLFRGLHNMAKVQRFFTRSDYDHVAIFLRSGTDLYFLEATGTDVYNFNWFTCLILWYFKRELDSVIGIPLSKINGMLYMKEWSLGIWRLKEPPQCFKHSRILCL